MTPTPKDPVDALPREQFEKWARERGHDTHRSSGDGYLVYSVQIMWMGFQAGRDIEASARALAAVPAAEVQESVRWKQLVHMVERGVAPEILVDWINHPNRLDYAAKLRAEHG